MENAREQHQKDAIKMEIDRLENEKRLALEKLEIQE